MSSTMTSDMVRGGLRPFMERVEQPQRLTPSETRELLANSTIPLLLLENLWQQAQGMIDRGVERGTIVAVLRDLSDLTERCVKAFESLLAQARATGLGPDEVTGLEKTAQDVRQMRGIVTGHLQRLEVPPPPVDPSLLHPRNEERVATGYVNLDDLAASVSSNGSWS